MHVVLCSCGGRRYAVSTNHLREVISLVQAMPVPDSPPWLNGLINYHGQLVPLVDTPRLLGSGSWEPRMSSRILVVETEQGEPSSKRWVALLVQSVLDCEDIDFQASSGHASVGSGGMEFLGPVALTDAGTVQLIEAGRVAAMLETTSDTRYSKAP
jgi:chemotaxis signal transduction protein